VKIIIILLLTIPICFALDSAHVAKVDAAFFVDGQPDIALEDLEPLHAFTYPWHNDRGTVSDIRMAWNDSMLYFYATLYDTFLVAGNPLETDPDSCNSTDLLELHFGPDPTNPAYFSVMEFNINLLTRSHLRKCKDTGKNDWYEPWDISGVQRAVVMYGTPDDNGDRDTAWHVEMAIPFRLLSGWQAVYHTEPIGWNPLVPPSLGSVWGFNVTRQNMNEWSDPQVDYSVWSFNGNFPYISGTDTSVHFHDHLNFGRLVFDACSGVEKKTALSGRGALSAHPNPFNPLVIFRCPNGRDQVEGILSVYNAQGRRVAELPFRNGQTVWKADGFSAGVYLARLTGAAGRRLECRIVLVR